MPNWSTLHPRHPRRSDGRDWTTVERSRNPPGTGFDHDAWNARHAPSATTGLRDVEDLTLLAGLETAPEDATGDA